MNKPQGFTSKEAAQTFCKTKQPELFLHAGEKYEIRLDIWKSLWQVQVEGPDTSAASESSSLDREDSSSPHSKGLAAHEHLYSLFQQPEEKPG